MLIPFLAVSLRSKSDETLRTSEVQVYNTKGLSNEKKGGDERRPVSHQPARHGLLATDFKFGNPKPLKRGERQTVSTWHAGLSHKWAPFLIAASSQRVPEGRMGAFI